MIQNEKEYKAIADRIEVLLSNPANIEEIESKGYNELNVLSDLVADYEEKIHPIPKPTLVDLIRLQMAEKDLSQNQL